MVEPTTAATMIPPPDSRTAADPADRAVALAEELLRSALRLETRDERRRAGFMAGLVGDAAGKQFTVRLADEVFRSGSPRRQASLFTATLDRYGLPRWLPPVPRAMLGAAGLAAPVLPGVVMPAVRNRLRQDTRHVILPGEPDDLNDCLLRHRNRGIRLNVNHLGEAVLGEQEAARRLDMILAHLRNPLVDYISVKISAIFSQINLTAWEESLQAITDRLRVLYRAAMAATDENGSPAPAFVNLDMEEYRDLHLTVEAFRQVLDEPEFRHCHAGIVLQAYLPDSWAILQDLTEWALARRAAGGSPIKIRLVKGANLAMERTEAEMHGWPAAPYSSKAEVDANFRRMMDFALHPDRIPAVHIGVGSHNLFDIALALTLARDRGITGGFTIEMLAGMADHQARAVLAAAGGLLLYAPVVVRGEFLNAMAYLVRRLDENTAPANFLHDLFSIRPGSEAWERQKRRFLDGWNNRHAAGSSPRRTQDRTAGDPEGHLRTPDKPFRNEPDTDWSLPANRRWAAEIRRKWSAASLPALPVQAGGNLIHTERLADVGDPSRPGTTICQASLAGDREVDVALKTAAAHLPEWSARPVEDRAAVLHRCATMIASRRADLIGAMMREGAKAMQEADPEVSEAVDFARYYAGAFRDAAGWLTDVRSRPLGVVVVAPPWNFPCAIPCGGVLAALMAGNTVILKPAPEAILTSWILANCLWDAGVPRHVLQFVPCPDDATGRKLLTDPRTAAVILTGAWETARMFRSWRPDIRLFAETSGKNALIVTAYADRDLAIRDLVRSAFGHSGQKCSAASLAILEAEVYDDPVFRRQLRDAAASLRVGPAHEPGSVVTPLIREPGSDLLRALTTLDPGEEWLLEPVRDPDNPGLWSPGIRLGVRPGSWFHRTECFGPVLGLMRASSLDEAIAWQNSTRFGLTAGIHSLDPRETARWRERVEAGNAYINRSTTGAIVNRQPFGGWKYSSVGPGAKAGGPNYVLTLCDWEQVSRPARLAPPLPAADDLLTQFADAAALSPCIDDLRIAARSFSRAWRDEFAVRHDPTALASESNDFLYRPVRNVLLRVDGPADVCATAMASLAAAVAGCGLTVSAAENLPDLPGIEPVVESGPAFAERLASLAETDPGATVRTLRTPSRETLTALAESGLRWINAPVLTNGRLELLRWTREQSITETRHRYGLPRPPHAPGSRRNAAAVSARASRAP